MAICPEIWLRNSTSSGVKDVSVLREIDRRPSTRPWFTSGIIQLSFTPSAAAMAYASEGNPSLSRQSTTTGFILSNKSLAGCITSSSSLANPLPCGKSMANTLNCPGAASGSEMATTSPCMTSRMFADTARNSSRSPRFDVIRFVTFRSNCSRSF